MRVPDDCAGVAGVCTACFPDWPISREELADQEARRPPERLHKALVALEGHTVVGYGFVQEPDVAARAGRLRIRVLVATRTPGQGRRQRALRGALRAGDRTPARRSS